jgi:hypothetical protein
MQHRPALLVALVVSASTAVVATRWTDLVPGSVVDESAALDATAPTATEPPEDGPGAALGRLAASSAATPAASAAREDQP